MHTARHLLIYHLPLGEPDGTSVMLHRLYAECAEHVLHVSFRAGRHPPPAEFRRTHVPGNAPWPFTRGTRLVRRLYPTFALPALAALAPGLRRARADWHRSPGTALVCVYNDEHAARARVLLRRCGVRRYVLMLMDLLDEQPVSPATTPALVALARDATALIMVSERLGTVFRPFTAAPQIVITPPCGFSPGFPAERHQGPFRALATGALYSGRDSFFENVFLPGWCAFAAQRPGAELLYLGTEAHKLSPAARHHVRTLDRCSGPVFAERLASASVGILPVLHQAGSRWQYSVPARLADYLAAGLPILTPVCRDTATADFLSGLPAGVALPAPDSATVERTLLRLHDDVPLRTATADAAVRFARERLDLPQVRSVFYSWMKQHSDHRP